MRRQARDAAESLTQRFAAEATWAECGVTAEPVLREGIEAGAAQASAGRRVDQALSSRRRFAAEQSWSADHALGKTGGLSARPGSVVVVPGALTRDEIRAIALPMAAAVSVE